jgi:transposase
VRNAHDLPNDVDHLKRLVQTLQLEIERLKIQLSQLRRWKFGRSSEQLELQIEQIQLSLEAFQAVGEPAAPSASPAEAPTKTTGHRAPRRHRPARRALPAHLPRETIVHPVPAVLNGCRCAEYAGCSPTNRRTGSNSLASSDFR